jgi:hypothetical protein
LSVYSVTQQFRGNFQKCIFCIFVKQFFKPKNIGEGEKPLSVSQINVIIKAVKEGKTISVQRHSNPKKMRRTGDIVASSTAPVDLVGSTTMSLPPCMT